jgi:virginiamycin B lyase
MRMKGLSIVAAGSAIALVLGAANALHAQAAAPPLSGSVSSAAEGPMEGVLVSAKRAGSTITVTVASDAQGRYRFPAGTLAPGQYGLRIRAAGYDLAAAAAAVVTPEKTTTADLRLTKTKNLAAQLSDAEWLMSMPGSFDEKRDLNDCNSCHSLGRIVNSKYTAEQFQTLILPKMAGGYYTNNSSPEHAQKKPGAVFAPNAKQLAMSRPIAEYLARINLSGGRTTWTYPLKTMPRPKGRATHVLITEYDLPRPDIAPHDVVVTQQHEVYFSSFHEQFLGQLDPKTGAVTQYPTPVLKPGFPTGSLDLEYDARSGDLWLAMMHQGGILKFDPKTKAMQTWSIPAEFQNDVTQQAFLSVPSAVDGKLWIKDSARRAVYRFDPATGTFESFGPVIAADGHSIFNYGIYADSKNDMYGLDYPGFVYGADRTNDISHVDAQTSAMSSTMVPTHQSRPRRGRFDAQDRLWFAEFDGNNIGMFDARTKAIKEWPLPGEFTFPYDAVRDKDGQVWTGSMFTDQVIRLDSATGRTVSYLLPRSTNIRRVFVDDSTAPATLWVGSNHGGSIVRVQPQP